jgi:hypothetical protein
MAEGLTAWLFWQALDRLDYSLTLAGSGAGDTGRRAAEAS